MTSVKKIRTTTNRFGTHMPAGLGVLRQRLLVLFLSDTRPRPRAVVDGGRVDLPEERRSPGLVRVPSRTGWLWRHNTFVVRCMIFFFEQSWNYMFFLVERYVICFDILVLIDKNDSVYGVLQFLKNCFVLDFQQFIQT